MENILRIICSTEFFYSIFRVTTPILLAALGAMITSRAGVVNIGLEGIMLFSALAGVVTSAWTQSAAVGLLAMVPPVARRRIFFMVLFTFRARRPCLPCGRALG